MSRDLGRDVPDLEKLYARKLWADFSYPKTGGGAYFAFFLGSDNSHTTPPKKLPPDEEDLLWGWCVFRGPL